MPKIQIKSTKDYKQFKKIKGNRPVNEDHVNNIVRSIQKQDLLRYSPLVVNENLEIIDGQHRLAAAKTIKATIYFLVGKGLNTQDMVRMNAYNKSWSFKEYLHYWCEQGKNDYFLVRETSNKYKISPNLAAAILQTDVDNTQFSGSFSLARIEFKNGEFKIPNYDGSIQFIEELLKFKKFTLGDSAWKDREFVRAVWKVFHDFKVSPEFLGLKLRNWPKQIMLRSSTREYLTQLEEACNHNSKNSKKVRFT